MNTFFIYLKDYYRFHFNKKKNKTVNDLSLWNIPFFDIHERQYCLTKLELWLSTLDHDQSPVIKTTYQKNIINSEDFTNNLIKNPNTNLSQQLFTIFNKKKYIPEFLSQDFKFLNQIINLKTYCNLSSIFLLEYEQTQNPQFLNTSLKINDFLLHCQIESKNNKLNGAITDFFPCYYNSFHITAETNELFAENLKKELFFLNSL